MIICPVAKNNRSWSLKPFNDLQHHILNPRIYMERWQMSYAAEQHLKWLKAAEQLQTEPRDEIVFPIPNLMTIF